MKGLAMLGRKVKAQAEKAYDVAKHKAKELSEDIRHRVEAQKEEKHARKAQQNQRPNQLVLDYPQALIMTALGLLELSGSDREQALEAMDESQRFDVQYILDQIIVADGLVPVSSIDPPGGDRPVRRDHQQQQQQQQRRQQQHADAVMKQAPASPSSAPPRRNQSAPPTNDLTSTRSRGAAAAAAAGAGAAKAASDPFPPKKHQPQAAQPQMVDDFPSKPSRDGGGGMEDLIGFDGPKRGTNVGERSRPAKLGDRRDVPSMAMPAGLGELMGVNVERTSVFRDEAEVDDPNEPEERKRLRRERLQRKRLAMEEALKEKQQRDMKESLENQAKSDRKGAFRGKIQTWSKKTKGNIRACLASLQEVLWEEANWKPLPITDLVEDKALKKGYQKALLIVHPDKVKNRGGTVDQIVLADMIFDELKTAWGKHEGKAQ